MAAKHKLKTDPLDKAPAGFARTARGWATRIPTPAGRRSAQVEKENKELRQEVTDLRAVLASLNDRIEAIEAVKPTTKKPKKKAKAK